VRGIVTPCQCVKGNRSRWVLLGNDSPLPNHPLHRAVDLGSRRPLQGVFDLVTNHQNVRFLLLHRITHDHRRDHRFNREIPVRMHVGGFGRGGLGR